MLRRSGPPRVNRCGVGAVRDFDMGTYYDSCSMGRRVFPISGTVKPQTSPSNGESNSNCENLIRITCTMRMNGMPAKP